MWQQAWRAAVRLAGLAILLAGAAQTGGWTQTIPGIPNAPAGGVPGQANPKTGSKGNTPRPIYYDRAVTLHIKGDLHAALDALLTPTPVNYVYALRAVPMSARPIDLERMPFDQALSAVLRAHPTVPPIRAHLAGSVLSLMQDDPPGEKPLVAARPVTLRLKNIPIQDAFHALFAALGTDFNLDSTLTGYVTLAGHDLFPSQTVRALAKQSPVPLIILERGNTFIIRRKSKQP